MKDYKQLLAEKAKNKEKEPLKKGQGADDKQYLALMGEYKMLRRNPQDKDKANKILEQAFKLAKEGDVSEDARVGAAYL